MSTSENKLERNSDKKYRKINQNWFITHKLLLVRVIKKRETVSNLPKWMLIDARSLTTRNDSAKYDDLMWLSMHYRIL